MFDLAPPRSDLADMALRALPQTQEFAKALIKSGQRPLLLDRMQDTVVLRRRIWGRINAAMINRADLSKPARLLEILQEEGLKRTPILLSPESPTPELARLGALPLMTPASVAQLDLDIPADMQRARLHQKWRNRLVQAENAGLKITRQNMPIDASHWLLQADAKLQQKRGYRSWPVPLTLAYAEANPGKAKLFQAFDGTDCVAGILVLTHGQSATYHIAHSLPRGKALNANNLLLWSALHWLRQKGIKRLDLGLINTEDAEGLARFKLGTGAEICKLGGTWLYWPPLGRRLAPLARWDLKLMQT